jgi:uncharacterized protein with HEPN domain
MRIEDILDAIDKIDRYTKGMSFNAFKSDEKTVDAVIRNITVIGEASRYIPADIQDRFRDIPWDEMKGIRNVIVHEYFGMSHSILWQTTKHNFPPLAFKLKRHARRRVITITLLR